jgi:heme/copper-type cytochrome/quinol oxidase subunit 2
MDANPVNESAAQSLSNQDHGTAPALWNPEAAGGWSLIFTPIFGAILVLKNWQALGAKEKIRGAQLWLIASIIMVVVQILVSIPLLFVYLVIWYFASAKSQAKYVSEKWGKEYPRKSWLWPLLIGFGTVIAIFVFIFVIGLAQAILSQQ